MKVLLFRSFRRMRGVLTFGSLLVSACSEETAAPPIVLVTIDTLRSDHLGSYGYFRDTSPHLDALAREGVRFERAVAPMPTTLPSHLSLFTSRYPRDLGLLANRSALKGPYVSRPGSESVAVLLRESGYRTAAFVSAKPVSRFTGIDAGFETFDEPPGVSRRASRTTDRALEWLGARPAGVFFLWVHYWEPHEPNRPPPHVPRYRTDAALETFVDARGVNPALLNDAPPRERALFFPSLAAQARSRRAVAPPRIDRAAVLDLYNRYDGDVRYVDAELGRLFAALSEEGLLERSIVAVTADHGQSLGEHDWLGHNRITNGNLYVPLVVRFPDPPVAQPAVVSDTVSLVDVMPTLLARLDVPAHARLAAQAEGEDVLSGRALRGHAFSQRTSHLDHEQGARYSLLTDRWRYVRRDDGGEALFDLEVDPNGHRDVVDEHPGAAARLRAILEKILARRAARRPEAPRRPGDEEFEEQLKSLGYAE